MKKMLVILLALLFVLSTAAYADDLSVTIIPSPDQTVMETLSLDDMKLGESYKIAGYATVEPLSFTYFDCFPQYNLDQAGNNATGQNWDNRADLVHWDDGSWFLKEMVWMDSGTSAEFAWMLMDLTNLQKESVDFTKEIAVKVVYDDEYEYAGWVRQFNYDYKCPMYRKSHEGDPYLEYAAINPENSEPVGMVYTGHYVIGCTLPNVVVEDEKAPLRIEITLGDNDLTYNIRR